MSTAGEQPSREKPWLKFYEPGVPKDLEPAGKTLPRYFRETLARHPEATALSFMGRKLSFRELGIQINRFSNALAGTGLPEGAKIALHLPNCPQFVIAYGGALQAGYTVVPCNPLYVERELEHQLNDSDSEAIVTLTRFYPLIKRLEKKTGLKKIIVANIKDYFPPFLRFLYTLAREKKEGDRVALAPEDISFEDFLSGRPDHFQEVETALDAPACLLYTGGTTGTSKGAVLNHRNLATNVLQTVSFLPDFKAGEEKGIAVLPFFHSYGLTTCLNMLFIKGGTLVLVPRFDLKMILKLIDREKPTLFPGVPTLYVALINYPDLNKYDMSSIRVCNSGAAPLPVEVQTRFEAVTGGRLIEGYGLTEASPVTHSNPVYGTRKAGSIGLPLPATDARVVDLDDPEREMPPGERGELVVKGPQVMAGYYNQPEETGQVLREGWLHTGDIAVMDEDGFFYIVDRLKDLVIAGGYNIVPREIEEVLFSHDKVQEAAVTGVPDPYRGETIKAFVVLREGEKMTEQELIDFCKENLAAYKVPKRVEFRSELPKSMVGKVLRRALIEEEEAHKEG